MKSFSIWNYSLFQCFWSVCVMPVLFFSSFPWLIFQVVPQLITWNERKMSWWIKYTWVTTSRLANTTKQPRNQRQNRAHHLVIWKVILGRRSIFLLILVKKNPPQKILFLWSEKTKIHFYNSNCVVFSKLWSSELIRDDDLNSDWVLEK